MPDGPAFGQFGTGMIRNAMPETVRYRNKETMSGNGMFRYWTEIDADAKLCYYIVVADNSQVAI
jgi:hypothetical protein